MSRLKTPDGENIRSADLSNDVGTVLDETGNELQLHAYSEMYRFALNCVSFCKRADSSR